MPERRPHAVSPMTDDRHRERRRPTPRAARDLEDVRLGAGAHDVDFEVAPGRGHGARRRQRRRQVDADQVHRRHPRDRRAARSSSTAKPVNIHGPKDAAKLGIEVVYQDLALCDNLDVVQNMYLGREERDALCRLDEPAMEQRAAGDARRRSRVTHDPVGPSAGRDACPAASGSRSRSPRPCMWNSKLVILDEPTAALGVAQTGRCSSSSGGSPSRGSRVVLISHNLHDIFEVATRITVLRLGRNVGVYERDDDHAAGGRPGDHRRHSDQGRGHRGDRAGGGGVSSDADVVAPGIGLPGGDDAEERYGPLAAGARQRQDRGNLGVAAGRRRPRSSSSSYFGFTATNFFTAANFVNVIVQMAGVTMIAFGVVFVLLLGEIDLSIGYVSGIAAVAVGRDPARRLGARLPGMARDPDRARGRRRDRRSAQGTIVAKVGVPSFVVTLAGLLIWQGVILQDPRVARRDHHRGQLDQRSRRRTTSPPTSAGSLRPSSRADMPSSRLGGAIGQRRAGLSRQPWIPIAKLVGVAVACFGTVAICNHATRPAACPEGTPLTRELLRSRSGCRSRRS